MEDKEIKHEVGDVWEEPLNAKDCRWMLQFSDFRDGFDTRNKAIRMAWVFKKTVSIDRKNLLRVKLFLDKIESMFNNEFTNDNIKKEYNETFDILYKALNGENGPEEVLKAID